MEGICCIHIYIYIYIYVCMCVCVYVCVCVCIYIYICKDLDGEKNTNGCDRMLHRYARPLHAHNLANPKLHKHPLNPKPYMTHPTPSPKPQTPNPDKTHGISFSILDSHRPITTFGNPTDQQYEVLRRLSWTEAMTAWWCAAASRHRGGYHLKVHQQSFHVAFNNQSVILLQVLTWL